ncbi:MAG: ATP-binding protein [Candidatus Eremiobacteraeota bacterium]|nr:ATP-binding protein [Candidatus Eremiobacteraeota bacterium]
MKRYLYEAILKDLTRKMVFVTGPRQVGKTFLARDIEKNFNRSIYLNNDDIDDARAIRNREWPLNTELIVLDEIHKLKDWKNYLKGTFDTRRDIQKFLVTGSARLDTFRQTGDSLAGRYFLYHLNPLSVKELSGSMAPYEIVSALNRLGGFPEPFLSASDDHAGRWRKQYYTDIVREDIMDFSRINEIRSIRLMLEMLRRRVGSPVSYSSLAEDLQLAPNTVRKYIDVLESLNIIFIIRPLHRNIARSLLKEPKIYFFDSGYVDGDEGVRLENTVAVCLLKHVQYLQDAKGTETALHYIRTRDGKEVDFALAENGVASCFIEVKLSEGSPGRFLKYFKERYPSIHSVQLVHNLHYDREINDIQIVRAGEWLSQLSA